ncbi:conserved hypothetical protein [Trichinella spiralis]|uniref:Uncharacterized protein n=1 Tax=Trichinella spiralis TaxID=6334 RepID=E5SQC1_TRISP|nr:conserved hypothetical protein [Trichinella spiralis]KRY30654.1 hypothetical protein T01_7502 [Trichinella spiralis]
MSVTIYDRRRRWWRWQRLRLRGWLSWNQLTHWTGGTTARRSIIVEFVPTVQRFARPNPKTAGYADDQRHQIFQHKSDKFRLGRIVVIRQFWANLRKTIKLLGDRISTLGVVPSDHPPSVAAHLDQIASDQAQRRHGVQYTEDADADDQLFQFFNFAAVNVNAQRVRIPIADAADAAQDVAVDALRCQDDDHQNRRCTPSGQVKIVTFRLDRLVAPLQSGRQKPSHIQHDPPNAAGNSVLFRHRAAVATTTAAGDAAKLQYRGRVDPRPAHLASRQADDRPFRIAESTHVDQKRQHSEKSTGSTHHRPNANPYAYNFQLLVEHTDAARLRQLAPGIRSRPWCSAEVVPVTLPLRNVLVSLEEEDEEEEEEKEEEEEEEKEAENDDGKVEEEGG